MLSFVDHKDEVVLWANCAHGLATFIDDDPAKWIGERVTLYIGLPYENSEREAVLVKPARPQDGVELNDTLGRDDSYPM